MRDAPSPLTEALLMVTPLVRAQGAIARVSVSVSVDAQDHAALRALVAFSTEHDWVLVVEGGQAIASRTWEGER